jgi:hypothetical protein
MPLLIFSSLISAIWLISLFKSNFIYRNKEIIDMNKLANLLIEILKSNLG